MSQSEELALAMASNEVWAKGQLALPDIQAWMREHYREDLHYEPWKRWPEYQVTDGLDAFIDFVLKMLEGWEEWRTEVIDVEEHAGGVVNHILIHGRGRDSGIALNGELYQAFVIREGKIAAISDHGSREGARAAIEEMQERTP
jgi:hypothetical protein